MQVQEKQGFQGWKQIYNRLQPTAVNWERVCERESCETFPVNNQNTEADIWYICKVYGHINTYIQEEWGVRGGRSFTQTDQYGGR